MADEVLGSAFVRIRAKLDDFNKDVETGVGKAGLLAAGAIVSGLASVKIGKFLQDSFVEGLDATKIAAQTTAVLKSTGEAAGISASHIDELTASLQRKQTIDDDQIRVGANLLLTFKNIRNETDNGTGAFDRATKVIGDMAAALGTDLSSSAIQVGKALQDPINGVSALQRVGVSFSEAQKTVIKNLVDTGQTAKAQALILTELESEFAGSAAAQATSADRARIAYGNLKETIGQQLAPAFNVAIDAGTKLIGIYSALPPAIQVGVVATGGIIAVSLTAAQSVLALVEIYQRVKPAVDAARVAQEAKTAADALSIPVSAAAAAAAAENAGQLTLFAAADGEAAIAAGAAHDALALETGQLVLFTPAAAEAAGAADALAVAEGRVATAGTEASVGGLRAFAAALGPIALGVGAIVGTGLLVDHFINTGDASKAAADKISNLATVTNSELVPAFDNLAASMLFKGDKDAFKQIAENSEGDAQRIIAALRAAGRDTSDYEKILAKMHQTADSASSPVKLLAQNSLVNSKAAAAAAADNTAYATAVAALAAEAKVAAPAVETLAEAIAASVAASSAVAASTFGVVDAQEAFQKSLTDTAVASGGASKAAGDQAQKARSLRDAQESVTAATDKLREAEIARFLVSLGPSSDEVLRATFRQADAARSVANAYFDVQNAIRAANRAAVATSAQSGADRKTRAELGVASATRAVEEAQFGVTDAESALSLKRSSGIATADELRRGELAVAAAKDRVVAATIDLHDAQNAANDVDNVNLDLLDQQQAANDAVEKAKQNGALATGDLADAQRELNDTLARGTAGSKDMVEADKAVEQAHKDLRDATDHVTEAQDALKASVDGVGGSLAAVRDRYVEVRDKGKAYIDSLIQSGAPVDTIRAAYGEVADQLDRIKGLTSPAQQAATKAYFDGIAQAIQQRALADFFAAVSKGQVPGIGVPDFRPRQSHSGGVIGVDPGTPHSGALKDDEFIRILQRGETVLTTGQAAFFRDALTASGSRGGGVINVTLSIPMIVQGPMTQADAERFAPTLQNAVVMAGRHLIPDIQGALS